MTWPPPNPADRRHGPLCASSVAIGIPHQNHDPVPWSRSCLMCTPLVRWDPEPFFRIVDVD